MSGHSTKRKVNWAIPGLLAMIAIIVAIATMQSLSATDPDVDKLATTCGSCHTMDQHVVSWQVSSHKEVACTSCHADPGVMGWAKMQYGRLQMVLSDRKGLNDLSHVATTVPNERCINCHAREMPWVMQDLEPPQMDQNGEPIRVANNELQFLPALAGHDLHLTMENPLNCTACHSSISHGPEVRADRVEVMHDTCLECHAREQVTMAVRNTISCSACHVELDKVSPDSHKSAAFRESHGTEAKESIASCQQCHLNPGITKTAAGPHTIQPALATSHSNLVKASTGAAKTSPTVPQLPAGSIAIPEGTKDACATCHGITMPHPTAWLTQHATGFNEKPELCASCHGTREQGFNMAFKGDPRTLPTTDPQCINCHAQPMPHPDTWEGQGHQLQAKLSPQSCKQCHSSENPVNPEAAHAGPQFCLNCHLNKADHPAGYVAEHKNVLAKYGNNQYVAGCTQCHTEKQNTCTSCHTDGLGQQQKWHPKMWWVGHARTTTPQNAASCATCHDYIQPSCSQCHTKY